MEIYNDLKNALLSYNKKEVQECVEKTISMNLDANKTIEVLSEGMALIGDKFARNEIFLPAMMLAANVMNAGMSILKIKIEQERIQINYRGKVIIGTVFGDIHDIGKNLVKILLDSQGFQVIDLGVNVKSDVFIKSIKDNKPDILALSALLTTTAPEMGKTIQAIKEANLRDSIKIMIGGAAITEKFAISIGADGYEPTAPLAVKLANEFVNKHN